MFKSFDESEGNSLISLSLLHVFIVIFAITRHVMSVLYTRHVGISGFANDMAVVFCGLFAHDMLKNFTL